MKLRNLLDQTLMNLIVLQDVYFTDVFFLLSKVSIIDQLFQVIVKVIKIIKTVYRIFSKGSYIYTFMTLYREWHCTKDDVLHHEFL